MILPSRHILMARKSENEDLFDEILCADRWTRNYYFGTQRVFVPPEDQPEIPECVLSSITFKKKVLSEYQKYRKANKVAQKLPSLVAEIGTSKYLLRLKVLVDLQKAWENNEEIKIVGSVTILLTTSLLKGSSYNSTHSQLYSATILLTYFSLSIK
ncbi:uncharacterized protein LOC130664878 [Microplitis mediator]|uniref:uncharacterized protein LOC130664878 n=1 Tax=Microplitis mediator TaxID=375433 RepID=UPI0025555C0E|nr:uncharacterized protein LOC130664878 [Microplitis mediator]